MRRCGLSCTGVLRRSGLSWGVQVYLPSDGPEDGRAAAAVQALQREIDLMRDLEHRHIVSTLRVLDVRGAPAHPWCVGGFWQAPEQRALALVVVVVGAILRAYSLGIVRKVGGLNGFQIVNVSKKLCKMNGKNASCKPILPSRTYCCQERIEMPRCILRCGAGPNLLHILWVRMRSSSKLGFWEAE